MHFPRGATAHDDRDCAIVPKLGSQFLLKNKFCNTLLLLFWSAALEMHLVKRSLVSRSFRRGAGLSRQRRSVHEVAAAGFDADGALYDKVRPSCESTEGDNCSRDNGD